ncbi:MAG: MFS transporter [Steroidobacteraceae bacterium]|jgi:MFS family permease
MDSTDNRETARLVLALTAVVMVGNFYVYDSISPVADLLQRQRHFSDTQIGLLNAVYNWPNVLLIVVGGVLVDRYGAARMTLYTAAVCFVGAALTAFSPNFVGMAVGRLLFGAGAETLNIGVLAAIAQYFAAGRVAFAMGVGLAFGRAGSFAANMSPTWFARAYAQGWQPPLVIATLMASTTLAAALVYYCVDRRYGNAPPSSRAANQPRVARDLLHFGAAYWLLLALCMLWYAVMYAFRSTFSIKYFEHAHGLNLPAAGAMNSYVFLAAIFATPAFGWLCDRLGRDVPMLAFGALLLPLSMVVMAFTHWSLTIGTVLIGLSFSLVPAVIWPLTSKRVSPERFGTALGLMWVLQNVGIGAANFIAGWLNDGAHASAQNPAGYQPMMLCFISASALGFGFALLLWFTTARRT